MNKEKLENMNGFQKVIYCLYFFTIRLVFLLIWKIVEFVFYNFMWKFIILWFIIGILKVIFVGILKLNYDSDPVKDKSIIIKALFYLYKFTVYTVLFTVIRIVYVFNNGVKKWFDYEWLDNKKQSIKILYYIYFFSIGIVVRIFILPNVSLVILGFKAFSSLILRTITVFFRTSMLRLAKYGQWWKNQEPPKYNDVDIVYEGNLFNKIKTYFKTLYSHKLKPTYLRFKARTMQKQRLRVEKYESWTDKDTSHFLINNAIYFVIFFLILIVFFMKPKFFSLSVMENILTQSSVRVILALGVGGIIILQGTDLSLGRSVGFAAMISASLLQANTYASRFYEDLPALPLILPLIIAMLVSAFFSAINGFVVAKYKIHPFLATLGASVALYGILSMYFSSGDAGAQPIGGFDDRYTNFVIGTFNIFNLEIPKLIIYAIIISFVVWIIWNKTTFGKNMYAVGGNPEAANISGVSVMKTTILVYVMAGLLYGMGGFLEAARIGSVSNSTGINYELDAIAACVVGGISFSGGIGKVKGAITGVLMFTIITYGMNFLSLDVFYQYIVKGVIIVVAVALDTRKYILKT
jgi:methyl-galactoside transport system permease protein